MKQTPLTPPDRAQCQVERHNGYSFMTLGSRPGLVRCSNKPAWIAREIAPGSDGRRGSMSICKDCRPVLELAVKNRKAPLCSFHRIRK